MFSKALFKQSCKANGTMWAIITFAVCFMLACVMLISGNGNIGEVKNSIEDTIITKEIDAQMHERALSYYDNAQDGLLQFDTLFAQNVNDTLSCLVWCSQKPTEAQFEDRAVYTQALGAWQEAKPTFETNAGEAFADEIDAWFSSVPSQNDFSSPQDYLSALNDWQSTSPATQTAAVTAAYADACETLRTAIEEKAREKGFASDSDETNEWLGSVLYTLNPNGMFDDFYADNGENAPDDYDVLSIVTHVASGDVDDYLLSEERATYRDGRAEEGASVFLAGNMTDSETVEALLDALSSYGVTKEKYDSFGYTYDSVKHMAKTALVTYRGRMDYELGLLSARYEQGEFADKNAYLTAVSDKKAEISRDVSSSFLSTLPAAVSDALEEIGQADLYTLIVGSIFYKLAGLLLPIIYMIMASNNLIAGQVDSGSMAYVLSTSTKRGTVVFTQAIYLIGSLLAMFGLTTATGCVCLSLVTEDIELTYGNLVLLNLGAFLVLFALSGLCFFTSCVFDRSKRSMAIGGGLSIFALVAAMLGLFGSPVIPSVVRLDALNRFNYATVISLFDVISIIDGTNAYIAKFVILGIMGLIGYILGSIRFTKKDLPL